MTWARYDQLDDPAPDVDQNSALVMRAGLRGYAGLYSSFLRQAKTVAVRYGLDPRAILIEPGQRKMGGGQEVMIVDVALDFIASKAKTGDS